MTLAIDCGSTNHKVALFDRCLNRVAACSTPVAYTVRDGDRSEFDAEKIWRDTVWQIRQVCQLAEVEPSAITSIALASQAQTFVLLGASGHPVMPLVSWADKRAKEESAELRRQFGPEFHRHCSFPSPIPELQLSKLLWVRRHHPHWLAPEAKVLSLPSFVAWRLGGPPIVDTNLAAMSGLYSCLDDGWWKAAMDSCGTNREQLGELVPAGQAVRPGRPCPELRLADGIRIVMAGNDQTAGACANGGGVHQVVITLGTALAVYRHAGKTPGPFHPAGCWGPYPGGGFYELAARNEGCLALDWAVKTLMAGDARAFMPRAEAAAVGAALFYPQHLYGDTPWRGSDDLGSRARATLEGLCFSLRQIIDVDLTLKLSEAPVLVIGGGSNCRLWLQILSHVLNRPVQRGQGDALLGAAMMAQPSLRPPVAAHAEALWEPVPRSVAQYDELYRVWLERPD
ncbi:MAG TPA: FGGY-family carbohydrate kinase [Candidatus Saccharimonadales bacterium]|nr:FGGY-family carbohydrate kinase [Candidatus Saccharimonadales bacterium]